MTLPRRTRTRPHPSLNRRLHIHSRDSSPRCALRSLPPRRHLSPRGCSPLPRCRLSPRCMHIHSRDPPPSSVLRGLMTSLPPHRYLSPRGHSSPCRALISLCPRRSFPALPPSHSRPHTSFRPRPAPRRCLTGRRRRSRRLTSSTLACGRSRRCRPPSRCRLCPPRTQAVRRRRCCWPPRGPLACGCRRRRRAPRAVGWGAQPGRHRYQRGA